MNAHIARIEAEAVRDLVLVNEEVKPFVHPARGAKRDPFPKVQSAADLLKLNFPPIRWAVHDLVPEGVTLLVGAPKVGKSWLALQLGIAISSGTRVWNGRPSESPGDVLFLGLEDNDRRMQSRISKLRGAQSDAADDGIAKAVLDVSRLYFATQWPRMDQGGLARLCEWLAAHQECRLVIVDTLGRFRAPQNGNSSAYQTDYAVGAELKKVADRHHVAILLLHHNRKMGATDILDTVSGTQGLTGSVDAVLLLRRERGQFDAALYVTGRDIENEEDYALRFHRKTCTWSSCGNVHETSLTPERRKILEFLRVNSPSRPKDIADGIGKRGAAVRRLLQKMFADGDVQIENGTYRPSLIHSSGNSGNSGNAGDSGHTGCVIGETDDTLVTGVTTRSDPRDEEGSM